MPASNSAAAALFVAPAGPNQPGALGVVQLAGPGARVALAAHFSKSLPDQPGHIRLGHFLDGQGRPVDQVLIAAVPADIELFEITCHGGTRIVQRIVETLTQAGATLVPGEKLLDAALLLDNPVAREAYRLLPAAKTTLAVRFLLHQAHDGLSKLLQQTVPQDLSQALAFWPAVEYLLRGARIVLAGPPNAGKSTLLNALAQAAAALVADQPGTTRDYVQVPVDFAGLPADLIDTAGLGPTNDPLGDEAQRRSHEQLEAADAACLVLDATDKTGSQDFVKTFLARYAALRVLTLINKIDHPDSVLQTADFSLPAAWPVVEVSALRGTNLDAISSRLWRLLGLDGFDYRCPTAFTPFLAELSRSRR